MELEGQRYESLTKYAKRMGVTYHTAYRWRKAGKISTVKIGGSYFVPLEETTSTDQNSAALYARVSSTQNKDNLDRQLQRLADYAAARGYTVSRSVSEIASGLNDDRPKLKSVMADMSWTILVVEHKDRLTRFGFRYLEWLAASQGRRIEVINMTDNLTSDADLMEDFVSVVTSFCARLYGRRRSRRNTEKLIMELQKGSGDDGAA